MYGKSGEIWAAFPLLQPNHPESDRLVCCQVGRAPVWKREFRTVVLCRSTSNSLRATSTLGTVNLQPLEGCSRRNGMFTKFTTFIFITAFALSGSVAHAKVYDASGGQNGVSDQMLLHSIDQTPSLFGCDVGSINFPTHFSADSAHDGNGPDIFASDFNILDDNLVADSCAVPIPIPSPELFRNVAMR
jgi:hypothetical protein